MSLPVCVTPRPAGKFFYSGIEVPSASQKHFVRGVTYGTFAPGDSGSYPCRAQVCDDFALMREANVNTLRVYTEPPRYLLDEAQRHGLKVIVGLAWTQHVCFLDDDGLVAQIRQSVRESVRRVQDHPAVLAFALGNEIPAPIVRWHGKAAIEAFLFDLYRLVKREAETTPCTYVNYPPTDFLELPFLDFVCFNVFLHAVDDLRAYVAKLQHIAGNRPLVLTELGLDSLREGRTAQAQLLRTHLRAAYADGCAGVCVFSFTDDWWRGGFQVRDWEFGLVDAQRRPKPAYAAVKAAFAALPFDAEERRHWPKVSVVVCAYNAAPTLEDNLSSLERLDYPDYEVIVVDDGSSDGTLEIAQRHPFEVISVPNGGLSAARNLGLHAARGEIVAYTDADTRVDRDWLSHLVQPFLDRDVAGVGGPNVVPPDDPWVAQCVARAPGGPVHVMLDNITAEHIPGCNMSFRRQALLSVGGFDPTYVKAGDDVDICWRLQDRGHSLAFAPGALVFHHHRSSVSAYCRQQIGYGEGESFLFHRHTDRFDTRGQTRWSGRIYSSLPAYRGLFPQIVYQGRFGAEAFPLSHQGRMSFWRALPQTIEWQLSTLLLCVLSLAEPWLLLGACAAAATTLLFAARHAWSSKLDDSGTPAGALRYRLLITWLHLLQPWARLRGRIKGQLSSKNHSVDGRARLANASRLSLSSTLKLTFFRLDERFWDTKYTPLDAVLLRIKASALGALTPVRTDDGYASDYDLVLRAGRAFAFRAKLTAEDHGGMNRQFRARLALNRPWGPTLAALVGLGLIAASLVRMHLAHGLSFAPDGVVGMSLVLYSLNGVSVYGGQALHMLRQACSQHGMQLTTDARSAREPEHQHTVMS